MWPATEVIVLVRAIVCQWLGKLALLDQCSRLQAAHLTRRIPRRTLPSSLLLKVQLLMHKAVTHDNDTLRAVSKSSYDEIIVGTEACIFRVHNVFAVVHQRDRCDTDTDSVSKAHKGYLEREERVSVVTIGGEFQ